MEAFSLSQFGFNWLDLVILIVFAFYALEGLQAGFLASLFDFISFVLSFALALKLYSFFGTFLFVNFSIPLGFANAFGFFIAAALSEIALNMLSGKLFSLLVKNIQFSSKEPIYAYARKLNSFIGFLPGFATAFVLLSFLLTVVVSLPLSMVVKRTISESKIANILLIKTQGMEKTLNSVFGGAVNDTITFRTIEPQSDETIDLKFTATALSADSSAEKEMFDMLNKERVSRGLSALSFHTVLRDVGGYHCEDMFKRGYFSHYTPEGLSPFDRMVKSNISFSYAGENLALAPNSELAMQGLMNSPGHKANILSPNFGNVGIGVIDGGIYGEMFCQEFTD